MIFTNISLYSYNDQIVIHVWVTGNEGIRLVFNSVIKTAFTKQASTLAMN